MPFKAFFFFYFCFFSLKLLFFLFLITTFLFFPSPSTSPLFLSIVGRPAHHFLSLFLLFFALLLCSARASFLRFFRSFFFLHTFLSFYCGRFYGFIFFYTRSSPFSPFALVALKGESFHSNILVFSLWGGGALQSLLSFVFSFFCASLYPHYFHICLLFFHLLVDQFPFQPQYVTCFIHVFVHITCNINILFFLPFPLFFLPFPLFFLFFLFFFLDFASLILPQ